MNFGKCCECGSNKDVVHLHTDDGLYLCYECLKKWAEKYEDMEIKVDGEGKELYCWEEQVEDEEEDADVIEEDNVIEFINNYYYCNDCKIDDWVSCVEECSYCEICADEFCRDDFMLVVEVDGEEKTICKKCFAKISGIEADDVQGLEDSGIELEEQEVIQTELTGYWSKHPKYYKVINHTYNNIKSKI